MSVKCLSGSHHRHMNAFDFIWHLGNLFAVSVLFAMTAALGAKLIWRRALAAVRWQRLTGSVTAVAMLVAAAGFVVFGRDGRMATYGLMALAAALTLGWVGFRRRS